MMNCLKGSGSGTIGCVFGAVNVWKDVSPTTQISGCIRVTVPVGVLQSPLPVVNVVK